MSYSIGIETKLNEALKEMSSISKTDFVLSDGDGFIVAKTIERMPEQLESIIVQFIDSYAESQIVDQWLFQKLFIGGNLQFVLLSKSGLDRDNSYIIARMALSQIKNLVQALKDPADKHIFLKQVIQSEIPQSKIEEDMRTFHIRDDEYVSYIVDFSAEYDDNDIEMVSQMLIQSDVDFIVEIDYRRILIIKNQSFSLERDVNKFAHIIADNISAEAMKSVHIGYSGTTYSFVNLGKSYNEAYLALKVGETFDYEHNIFVFEKLGIGRLIYTLPADVCHRFLQEVLGENADMSFDDETIDTINTLFENNLNISETARQMYIHRNTLVYRLERIAKKIGLDIRTFEDAMVFKIAMMVHDYLKNKDTSENK